MSRKNQTPAPAPAAQAEATEAAAETTAAAAKTTEAAEAQQPAGVVTAECLPPEADPELRTDKGSAADPLTDADAAADLAGTPRPSGEAADYVAVWNVKTGGNRYAPGDVLTLTPEAAAPFLASGAITLKD